MENFSRPLEMMQCQLHKPLTGIKCFLKAELLLNMSNTADDHQQHGGDNTALVKELVQSGCRLTIKMIADEVNMNWETHLTMTEQLGTRKICANMVPNNLTQQQWDVRLNVGFDIQMHYGDTTASLLI
jgi:hypothetical protein